MRCATCGGVLKFLGCLGILAWYRCEACGMDQSRAREDGHEIDSEEDDDGDDFFDDY